MMLGFQLSQSQQTARDHAELDKLPHILLRITYKVDSPAPEKCMSGWQPLEPCCPEHFLKTSRCEQCLLLSEKCIKTEADICSPWGTYLRLLIKLRLLWKCVWIGRGWARNILCLKAILTAYMILELIVPWRLGSQGQCHLQNKNKRRVILGKDLWKSILGSVEDSVNNVITNFQEGIRTALGDW